MPFSPSPVVYAFAGIILCSPADSKELLGIQIELGNWNALMRNSVLTSDIIDPAGDGSATLNATRITAYQMNTAEETQSFFGIDIKHKLPIIPQLRYREIVLNASGQFTPESQINFGDTSFDAESNLTSKIDLGYKELTAYYSPITNWMQLDLGLSTKKFEGEIKLIDVTESETDDATQISQSVKLNSSPFLLFCRLGFEVPQTPILISHEIKYQNSGDEHFGERETKITYQFDSQAATTYLDAGYKKQKFISPSLGEVNSTIFASGPFFAIRISL